MSPGGAMGARGGFAITVSRLSISTDNSTLALALLPQVSGPPAPPAQVEKKSGLLHWLGHLFGR